MTSSESSEFEKPNAALHRDKATQATKIKQSKQYCKLLKYQK